MLLEPITATSSSIVKCLVCRMYGALYIQIVTPVRKWMEPGFTNIQHWREMPKGGHFAAFEQPGLFVPEVRDFFRTLRKPSA